MKTGKWTIRGNRSDNFKYLCDDLRAKIYSSHDSDNMRRFLIKFLKPGTQCDQQISMDRIFYSEGIEYEDAVSLYLYCGKIVYGWVWKWAPTGLGHLVDRVVYNIYDLAYELPDAVDFLRQEGILEKTWLQKSLAYLGLILGKLYRKSQHQEARK